MEVGVVRHHLGQQRPAERGGAITHIKQASAWASRGLGTWAMGVRRQ